MVIWDNYYGETARPPFLGYHLEGVGPDNAGGIVEIWASDKDTEPAIEYHYFT